MWRIFFEVFDLPRCQRRMSLISILPLDVLPRIGWDTIRLFASVVLSITDPSKAKSLSSAVTVSSLAAGQTLAFTGYSSTTDIVEGGSLVLQRGDWSTGSFVANSATASTNLTVTETDTLASLRDKINALNYGVTASIIGAGDDTFNSVSYTHLTLPTKA